MKPRKPATVPKTKKPNHSNRKPDTNRKPLERESSNPPKPTKSDLLKLLRELAATYGDARHNKDWDEHERLSQLVDDLQSELLSDRRLVRLIAQQEAAYKRWHTWSKQVDRRVVEIRHRLMSEGPTDTVIREIQELLREIDGR